MCKDDIACLPLKVSSNLGHLGPIVLCTKVSNQISLLDPVTFRTTSMDVSPLPYPLFLATLPSLPCLINLLQPALTTFLCLLTWQAPIYYRYPFLSAANTRQLTTYIVLDIEPINHGSHGSHHKWIHAEVQVARAADFGKNDQVFFTRTHLGHLLNPGDTALGYDLANAQLTGLDYDAFIAKGGQLPDVILVRKSYDEKRKRSKAKGMGARPWKLKQLNMEIDDASEVAAPAGRSHGRGRGVAMNDEDERERFYEELEEDPEMRQRINIYKDKEVLASLQQKAAMGGARPMIPAGLEEDGMEDDEDDGDLPEIPLDELLDEIEALQLAVQQGEEEEEEEEDEEMEDEEMEDATLVEPS